MTKTMFRSMLACLMAGSAMAWAGAGCDDQNAQQTASTPAAPAEALPAGLMAAQAPADPKAVADARKAGDGEEVVVRGRIAGQAEPFTEGRAQFQLVDMAVKACNENPDDKCESPWDMCCEDKKTVAENSVTVQVAGADGRPLKSELKGVNGLKELSEVTVKGKVQKSPDGKAVTINATEMYVKQG
jgi:hypothetical protein